MAHPKITKSEARAALLRSGYLIESRIETVLRSRQYYVAANQAYRDSETGKARELDVYGMLAEKAGPGEFDWLFVIVLVECVNNPQPLAFLMKEPLMPLFHSHEIKVSGLPVKFPVARRAREWQSLADYTAMEKYHHYCKGLVATQFCSFTRKKGAHHQGEEWMAWHEDSHFDAFRKLCDAVDDSVRKHFESWTFGRDREPVNIEMVYPVLVVEGDLFGARVRKRSVALKRADHVQYRRSTIRGQEEVEYQIDVVREHFFPRYLDIIEGEAAKAARLLRRRHKEVRGAIERIVQLGRRARSAEKIRAALEF